MTMAASTFNPNLIFSDIGGVGISLLECAC